MDLRPIAAAALAAAALASPALAQDSLPRPKPRPLPAAGKVDIQAKVRAYTRVVRDRGQFTVQNAAALMKEGYAEVLTLKLNTIDLGELDRDPHGLVRALFDLTLALDERCAEFHEAGQLDEKIGNAKRRVLRAIRFLREATIMRTAERNPKALYARGKPALATSYPAYHWSVHPDFRGKRHEDLPRTFILLCMGGSNVSATIARSASEDNTFSHLAIGYRSIETKVVDGKTYPPNTIFLVESLIETGVIIKPFEVHYEGVDRDVIFIARDQSKQAAIDAAADDFFKRANDALKKGKPLGYDFSMGANIGIADVLAGKEAKKGQKAGKKLPDPDAYFCAAIGHELFAKAGLELFPVRTRFNDGPNSRTLFQSWGIDPDKPVTAPGDADVSGVLLRVAEGAKIEKLEGNHIRQVVLRQMFRWMDEENYQLRWPWWVSITTAVAGGLNDTFLDIGKVPAGMNKEILRSFLSLDKAATLYNDALTAKNAAFRQKHGRSMTPHELVGAVEKLKDSVEGTDRWLRKMPWAQGRYEISLRWGKTSRLEVKTGSEGKFNVTRWLYDKKGRLLETVQGTATQSEKTLRVRYKRARRTPRDMRYRLQFDGEIRASAKEDRHGPRNNNNHFRRIGKGQKVAGPRN